MHDEANGNGSATEAPPDNEIEAKRRDYERARESAAKSRREACVAEIKAALVRHKIRLDAVPELVSEGDGTFRLAARVVFIPLD